MFESTRQRTGVTLRAANSARRVIWGVSSLVFLMGYGTGTSLGRPSARLDTDPTGDSLIGDAVIRAISLTGSDEVKIVVAIDTTANPGEALTADVVYVLQTTGKTTAQLPADVLRHAVVAFEPRRLRVTRANEAAPFLTLALDSAADAGERGMLLRGWGLARSAGSPAWGLSARGFAPALTRWATAAPSAVCTEGGPGSASCSIADCIGTPPQCSVTCQTGYYACCYCRSAHCDCKPN